MKKILSFVLASAMVASMAVTAFAVDYNTVDKAPGLSLVGDLNKLAGGDDITGLKLDDTKKIVEGATIYTLKLTQAEFGGNVAAYKSLNDFNKDYSFSYKIKSGPVASVTLKYGTSQYKYGLNGSELDDKYKAVYVEIKSSSVVTTDASTTWEVEVSLKDKKSTATDKSIFDEALITGSIVNDAIKPATAEDLDQTFEVFGACIDFDNFKNSIANFNFDFEDADNDTIFNVAYTAVQSGKINFAYDVKQNATIVNKYADVDFEFINFLAAPKLAKAASIKFYSDNAKGGVFQIEADGTVRNLGAKYNTTENAYEFKSSTLGTFFVASDASKIATVATSSSSSAAASSSSSATGSKANPGTGASDVVNVAVVMSVVSLAAAGAVAFKKASK